MSPNYALEEWLNVERGIGRRIAEGHADDCQGKHALRENEN